MTYYVKNTRELARWAAAAEDAGLIVSRPKRRRRSKRTREQLRADLERAIELANGELARCVLTAARARMDQKDA